jgi:hypothetical protein
VSGFSLLCVSSVSSLPIWCVGCLGLLDKPRLFVCLFVCLFRSDGNTVTFSVHLALLGFAIYKASLNTFSKQSWNVICAKPVVLFVFPSAEHRLISYAHERILC